MRSAGAETLRSFIAIELPADLRLKIVEHINHLRREFPETKASWSRQPNLHLTLKFLGNVPADRIAMLSDATQRAAQSGKPFEINFVGCGAFPRRAKPNVLWIGINDQEGKLQALHQSLEHECSAVGFERERRPFHPHLTIARLRNPSAGRPLAEAHEAVPFSPQVFVVSEIVVFKSELLREGSRHTPLSRHRLGAK